MPDITRSSPNNKNNGTFLDQANALLARFPEVDRAELLGHVTALYLMDFRYGNKREERAACDFLNLLQREAIKLRPAPSAADNDRTERQPPGCAHDGTKTI